MEKDCSNDSVCIPYVGLNQKKPTSFSQPQYFNIYMYKIVTEKGKRKTNEDAYVVKESSDGLLVGIFDGHGGGEAAQYTVEKLPNVLFANIHKGLKPNDALRQTFLGIDASIHNAGIQSGTTATVILQRDSLLHIAHVGDTRAVLIRDNKLTQLTKDHKITDPEELQHYRSSRWFREKSRLVSQGKLKGFKLIAVSRSLGDVFFEDAISPVPDIQKIKLQKNDIVIIATDGLWNFVGNDEVIDCVNNTKEIDTIPKELVKKSLLSGSTDNITVSVLTFQ
jgi:serine/threonine protein phosphatase PrpC